MFEVSMLLEEDSSAFVPGGAKGLINLYASNCAYVARSMLFSSTLTSVCGVIGSNLLEEKLLVIVVQGRSCHNPTPIVVVDRGFIDVDHPSHVYKLKKALYGLKQAPRAWYDELSKFLLHNHFNKVTIDPTMFIRHFKDDILVVQVYVDDIIFGSTNPSFELNAFSEADYAGCKDTFKSTFGGTQFLGENLVSWSSKKQDCTALSIAKAEYVSLSACCVQVIWMLIQLTDYGFHFNKILIYYDSKSAIAISCNPV
ncbi:retrovirus-related pol polyprotein from transposon TNT 1-94 [Tanacetum coccineum]